MKTVTSIFLLSIILIQTFSLFVYDAAYYLNKSYIADKLCVNKAKPATHCQGHCYLNKQKEKEQGGDAQALPTKKEKFESTAYALPGEAAATFMAVENRQHYEYGVAMHLQDFTPAIFHPPLA